MSRTPAGAELIVRRAGDRALLLEPPNRNTLAELISRLQGTPIPGVSDILPAARTVLVTLQPRADAAAVEKRLRAVNAVEGDTQRTADAAAAVEIPVRYGGEDLAETAALLGITESELIARHTAARWRCAFIGFAPGFGYLEAPEAGLEVPRRDQSRTAVPAGAVALAGGYSAVYPRTSPGGWRIIGTTQARLWDLDRPEPALLRPGTRVRFVAVEPS
ncbi:KipI family sensor histidine kinase inhibitor [Nocardia sp. GAS34]|uniref:5-oxoprolinase subunit B family protein n=1 Tax=unclassified Nocardia TaxID=2637762 RepID=UPI003D1EEF03